MPRLHRPRTTKLIGLIASVALIVGGLIGSSPAAATARPAQPGTTVTRTRVVTASTSTTPAQEAIARANYLRSFWSAPVPTLTEDPRLSANDVAHSKYLVLNGYCGHPEDSSKPGYSAAGDYGGMHSVVACGGADNPADAVDGWARTPLHGSQVINPRLTVTGYGHYSTDGAMDTLTHVFGGPDTAATMTWPNGPNFPFITFSGNEIPDPYPGNCPSQYTSNEFNNGAPLFVDFPATVSSPVPASASDVWLKDASGTSLPICTLTTNARANSSLTTLSGAILPLHALIPGMSYTASWTASGTTATWAFTVARARSNIADNCFGGGTTRVIAQVPIDLCPTLNSGDPATVLVQRRAIRAGQGPDDGWTTIARVSMRSDRDPATTKVTLPTGPQHLRYLYPGTFSYLPTSHVYALSGVRAVLHANAINNTLGRVVPVNGLAWLLFNGYASGPLDRLADLHGYTVTAASRVGHGAWRGLGRWSVNNLRNYKLRVTRPGTQVSATVHDPSGHALATTTTALQVYRRITGWAYPDSTFTASKNYHLISHITVTDGARTRICVQHKTKWADQWRNATCATTDRQGKITAVTAGRSGYLRMAVPASHGFLASYTEWRLEHRH